MANGRLPACLPACLPTGRSLSTSKLMALKGAERAKRLLFSPPRLAPDPRPNPRSMAEGPRIAEEEEKDRSPRGLFLSKTNHRINNKLSGAKR